MTAATESKRRYRMVARAESATATRETLLACAWRNFAERGFEEVRLSEVAADAGVSVPTVHAHFGSKEGLYVAAWDWHMAPEGARRDETPPGDVAAAVRVLYDSYDRDGDAVLGLLAQEARMPAVRDRADAGRRWHRSWVERTFGPLLAEKSGAARKRQLIELVVATDLLVW